MAALLVKDGLIVTYINEAYETLRMMEADILIEGGVIKAIGRDLRSEGTVLDAHGKLVLPGFINAHHHCLASLLSKGLAEGHNLRRGAFLENPMTPIIEAALSILSEEELGSLFRLAERGLIDGGTTTVMEACSLAESEILISSSQDRRLRFVVAPTLLAQGADQGLQSKEDRLGKNLEEAARLQGSISRTGAKEMKVWLGFHSSDICDLGLLGHIRGEAMRSTMRIAVHLPETEMQWAAFKDRHRKSPVECLSEGEFLGSNLLLSHCSFLSDADRSRLEGTGTHVVQCARASAERGVIVPFFPRYSAEANAAIGTDQYSSDMLEELRAVALLGKIGLSPEMMTRATDVFYGATVGGAKALGREDLGRIVEGYQADLLIFNTVNPRLRPMPFPLINVIYDGLSSDIETVIVGGEVVSQGEKRCGLEEPTAFEDAERAIDKVWTRARGVGIL